MRKGYKVSLLIVAIMLCGTIIMGTSYSLWSTTHTQTTANDINVGCFTMSFSETGTNINLSNTYPLSDTKGLATTPYEFTITNTCTIASSTAIAINMQTTSTMDASYLNIAYQENSGDVSTPVLLSSLETGTIASGDTTTKTSYILKKTTINPNETKKYKIWMYIPSTIGNEAQGKTFTGKVSVANYAGESTIYADATGANQPVLYQGLIPVKYDASGNTVVADTTSEWYNYANHNWANAVLVNCSDTTIKNKYFNADMTLNESAVGTTISDADILQYYVWIPRYKYLLWNAENGSSNEQAISITFERTTDTKSTGSTNGTWLTHPAFTFGTTELPGIWVGKFENSGTTTSLKILPDVTSLKNITVGDMFNATRNQELTYASNYGISSSEIDTHMMKNMEWGATAYLSSSIYGRYTDSSTCISSGCEVVINNNSGYTTGCSSSGCGWSTNGVSASTTGNQYGIYDMNGGAWEYVMGNMVDSSGNYYPSSSGLSKPDTKYYDSYAYSASTYTDHARGQLGDATKETLKTFGSDVGGWYSDYAALPNGAYSWFVRGGYYSSGANAGAFYFSRNTGGAYVNNGFRSVLSAQ
jgi:hypothetical protein